MRRLDRISFLLLPVFLVSCLGEDVAGASSGQGRLEAPKALAFGEVALGQRAERSLSLRNAGNRDLVVEGVDVPAPFQGGGAFPATLRPGTALEVPVAFAPVAPGAVAGVARVRTGAYEHAIDLTATGGESCLRCRPGKLDLGRPVVGVATPFAIECENTGGAAVEVRVEDEGWPALRWSPREEVSIAAGGVRRFDFSLEADRPETIRETIRFVSDATVLGEVQLSAHPIPTAVAVHAPACPNALDVGFAPPGARSTRTFFFENLGSRPLELTALEAAGPFEVRPPTPLAIPPDDPDTEGNEGRLEVAVTFAPAALGPADGRVTARFEDPATPSVAVCLAAYGGGPVISCSPAAVDFGPVTVGMARTEMLTCANEGTDVPETDDDRLQLLSIASAGPGFAVEAEPPPGGLGPGEATTVAVTFAPPADGGASGSLAVASNDPALPLLEVSLSATGLDFGPCEYRVEPEALDFGPVAAGGTPALLHVSIFNQGPEPCLVRDLGLAPGTTPAFSLPAGSVEAAVVGPGDRLAIPVRFAPAGAEAASGSLAFEISSPDAPSRHVPLSGATAPTSPCLQVFPESIDFGDARAGCAAPAAEVMVANTCEEPLEIEGIAWLGDAAAFHQPVALPSSLGPLEAVTTTVEFRPDGPGERLAGVRWTSSRDGAGRLLPLRGRDAVPSGAEHFPPASPQVDVLFVVQNGVAAALQEAAARALPSFLGVAEHLDIDWQFGVTTTGLTPGGECPGGAHGGEDGRLFPVDGSAPRIVRSSDENAVELAVANLAVGTCHWEKMGLEAAYRALAPPAIDHADDPRHPEPNDGNLGFLRPGARLAVVVLQNQVDQSSRSPEFYAAALRGAKRDPWREPSATGSAFGPYFDERAMAFQRAAYGQFAPHHSEDVEADFRRFGRAAFGRTHFFLKGRPAGNPAPGSSDFQVLSDGRPAPPTWSWDAAANAVVFDPLLAPLPHHAVEIRYTPACLPSGPGDR